MSATLFENLHYVAFDKRNGMHLYVDLKTPRAKLDLTLSYEYFVYYFSSARVQT